MTFSKKYHLVMAMAAILAGCSAQVDGTKEAAKEESRLQLKTLKVLSTTDIREEESIDAITTARQYTVQACLEDGLKVKDLSNRKVVLGDGTVKYTDVGGCVAWDKVVEIDYKNKDNCKVYNETIKIDGQNMQATAAYSIDSLSNTFSDQKKSKGCLIKKEEKSLTSYKTDSELVLERIELFADADTQIKRSDVKYWSYSTEYHSCISSYTSGKRLRKTNIEIEIKDPRTGKVHKKQTRTTREGCFQGVFDSTYEQYSYSKWIPYQFSVKVLDGILEGESVGRNVALNPWEPERTIFAVDTDPEYGYGEIKQNPIPLKNQIQIDGVMYILIGNDNDNFRVNDYLGLTISRSYQVVLNPRVYKGHRFGKTAKYLPLNDGKFKLSFMVLAPKGTDIPITAENYNDFTFITGAQKTVEVKNGIINDLISLQIKHTDLPKLAMRTVSVFKLEPLEDIGLDEAVVTGFFKAKIPWIKTNVFKSEDLNMDASQAGITVREKNNTNTANNYGNMVSEKDIEAWKKNILLGKNTDNNFEIDQINKADGQFNKEQIAFKRYIEFLFENINELTDKRTFDNPFKRSAKDIFIGHLNKTLPDLKAMSVKQYNETYKMNFTNEDINSQMNIDFVTEEFKDKLCKVAFNFHLPKYHTELTKLFRNGDYKECMKDFYRYFAIKKYKHVDKITKATPDWATGFGFSMGARYQLYEGHQESLWKNLRVPAFDIATKLDPLKFLSVGLRLFDFGMGKSWNDVESQGNGHDISTFHNMGVERFNLALEGQFSNCLIVMGKQYRDRNARHVHNHAAWIPADKPKKVEMDAYICADSRKEEISEDWYYMQEFTNDTSIMRDAYDASTVQFIKVLRGVNKYKEIENKLKDESTLLLAAGFVGQQSPDEFLIKNWGHMIENPELSEDDKGWLLLDHIDGSFPGTIEVIPGPQTTRTGLKSFL
ncbi:hypothetical protein HBN50_06495 [Halobacteriovorax sp. GB3]|uniref:hypothetical protein n=1 Tax=Halobacteriovorax sp. GB3 TaxID=2719615 RepID=UPI002360AFAA|nr:hypothetical protein [Halobacteriovorax sp. GB3]MDD0852737.1 hypothetical protein [Halobacteriovorax sp. GB3]